MLGIPTLLEVPENLEFSSVFKGQGAIARLPCFAIACLRKGGHCAPLVALPPQRDYISRMVSRSRGRPTNASAAFIQPCRPTVAQQPPRDLGWVHELKHDGYRLQIQINTLRSGHLRFYAAFRALRDGRHRNANPSSIACHTPKAVCPRRGGSGNYDERNHLRSYADGGCAVGSPHGQTGYSSNLACSGDRFWPSVDCCVDMSLRIWARQNNRDGNLTNCKTPILKRASVRNLNQLTALARPTKRPQASTVLKLLGLRL